MKETTALGAAVMAMKTMGIYNSIEEALSSVEGQYEEYHPGKEKDMYAELYLKFAEDVFK